MNTPQDKLDALFPIPGPAPRGSVLTPVRLAGRSRDSADKLVELLQDNHKRLHIFINDKHFHNHSTHHLLAIHSMGAGPNLLKAAYDTHIAYQKPAIPSPGPVNKDNWKEFLDDERYYQSYLKFFSDELLSRGPAEVLEEYIFSRSANIVAVKRKDNPNLLARFLGGFLHPFIHAGYGAEFGQCGMWAEGLAEACVQTPLPLSLFPDALFDNLIPSTPSIISRVASLTLSSKPTSITAVTSPHALAILGRVVNDPALKPSVIGLPVPEEHSSIVHVAEVCGDKLLSLLGDWTVGNTREELDKKIEEVMWMNVVIYTIGGWGGRGQSKDPRKEFNGDFFLMHLVTSSLFLPSLTTYLPPPAASLLLRAYFLTSLVVYIARGRPALPIADFYSTVSDKPTPPGPHPVPSQQVFNPELYYTNPPEAKKNWLAAGGDKIITPNPWLTTIQSTLVHPDEHLCKIQRALMHYAAMFGDTAPGAFSSLSNVLDGADVLDGTIFVRASGLTMNLLGWVREGQAEKSWDHSGFYGK